MPLTSADIHNNDLLNQSLERLKRTSVLEYTGEYGAEVTTFIPFAAWLKREGILRGRRIRTYDGMRPYYFFLSEDELEFKTDQRRWLPVRERYWPSNSTYSATASSWHAYPDYRQHYVRKGMAFQRPLIFVQNKFVIEWGVGPINYIPVAALNQFIAEASNRYTIIYSRPGSVPSNRIGYSSDANPALSYPDGRLAERFPNVVHLEKLCADQTLDYNQAKLEILAKCHLFVSVQGGGAHILAAFGNSLMLLLDREENLGGDGREFPHAYSRGPYKYLSKVPPRLLVTRNFRDYIAGLQVMKEVTLDAGNIIIPRALKSFVDKWSL